MPSPRTIQAYQLRFESQLDIWQGVYNCVWHEAAKKGIYFGDMSQEGDLDSKPLPQEVASPEKKWPIDVEKLSPAERDEIAEKIKAIQLREKEEADLQAQLEAKIARNDRFIDNNIAIENMTERMQRDRQETPPAPAVPFAAAAGGGMQPPHDPANDNVEAAQANIPHEGPFDAIADKDIEGWTNGQPAQAELVPQASLDAMTAQMQRDREDRERANRAVAETAKLDSMIAGNDAMIANNLSQEKMLDAANTQPTAPSPATDPSIIPPQTREPVGDKAIEEMTGVGSNWADAGRLASKIGTAAYEKTAEWLPHSPFGRFAARVQRAGMRLMNAPQELAYKAMVRWRGEHASAAEIDFTNAKGKVAEMTARLAEADAKRAATIAEHKAKGLPTADIAMVLEGERNKALRRIEKAQKAQDEAGKRIEHLNALKAGWAKKENDLAERTMANIDQRLAPEKAILDVLTVKKGEITPKLESLKRARDMGHQGLQELEAKLKLNPSLINNVAIPDKIEAVKELLGRIDDEYNRHTKTMNGIDHKMLKANNYISGWMGYRNEEARVTTQDRRYFNSENDQNIEEEQAHEAPNLTHAPESAPGAAIEKEPALELEPQEYVALWNVLYGKELKIKAETFATGMKIKQDEPRDIKKFEEYITKTIPQNTITKESLEARFTKIRDIVKAGRTN